MPYFLNDLRPAGFLGRFVPQQHPELDLPGDILSWSADQTLRYVTRYGWDSSGNLIVGDAAFRLYLENGTRSQPGFIDARARKRRYPELAEKALELGVPGSSAAGEQPKFLATLAPGPTQVLVKFSPGTRDRGARRASDLLVAEHLAGEILRARGHAAARSSLLRAGGRLFLEVERFDRVRRRGRRGLFSLLTLDAEFVGRLLSWSDTAEALAGQDLIDRSTLAEIRWRDLFGRLIGDVDMHLGNLSLYARGTRLLGAAPSYDMLPALYSLRAGRISDRKLEPSLPDPSDAPIWSDVHAAALELWSRLAEHELVSSGFRRIARANHAELAKLGAIASLLPK